MKLKIYQQEALNALSLFCSNYEHMSGNAVMQMSQEWVLRTMNKLIKKMPSQTYTTLKRFIEHNQYRARLFKLKPKHNNSIQISIYKIKNKGLKAFDKIKDTPTIPYRY